MGNGRDHACELVFFNRYLIIMFLFTAMDIVLKSKVEWPEGTSPRALTEPYVKVSLHTAPIVQPFDKVIPNEQTSLDFVVQYDSTTDMLF